MTTREYEKTIDWNQYWRESDNPPDDEANGSMAVVVDPFLEFVEKKGVPDSYADVGCGGGELAVTVAQTYPETTVVGYDGAEPVVDANRTRTDEEGPSNVQFDHAVLPDFEPDRQFDLVTAFFTLCYVQESERALQALYDAVAPGGYLVMNYHNRHAQSLFRTFAQDPQEYLGADSAWDPDHFTDQFELVLEGENLLSYDRIRETLNAWPQSLWSVVDAERYGAWKQNPLVFVPK
jgi:trans-aconitate methyltransferase